ncbi:MAG TPA: YciI family protein [Verrucomicrobiae bacterium]|nr:YciI family protein [Verrucomicrobiae bacterium]
MQYLLLIYDKESDWNQRSEADRNAVYKEYGDFTESIMKSGHFKAGHQLQPITAAATVRIRDQKRMVTDGPFAETREQLGGFYMIEATDLDDAIAVAARIPSARFGSIEVRPIVARNQ